MSVNRPVKVLICVASLDILGGQAVQGQRLLDAFMDSAEARLSFVPINPRLPSFFRRLQNVKYVRTIVTSIYYWFLLLKNVPQCDIVQAFSASHFSYLVAPLPAILIAKLFKKKTILNYHSGEAEEHLKNWRRTIKLTFPLIDKIVVPSEFLVEVFAKFGYRAEFVYNIVELEKYRFRRRKCLQPKFLANRNHEAHYDVATILRAFRIIQNKIPNAALTVAGDGSQRSSLERLAAELNLSNIDFIGRVAPEKMPLLYQQADIYLNSSVVDNQPLSIIEAFASGTPIISTNAGGIIFTAKNGENALLSEKGDFESLAKNALRLLSDAQLAENLSVKGRAEAEKYTASATRRKWLEIYQNLFENKEN